MMRFGGVLRRSGGHTGENECGVGTRFWERLMASWRTWIANVGRRVLSGVGLFLNLESGGVSSGDVVLQCGRGQAEAEGEGVGCQGRGREEEKKAEGYARAAWVC